MFVYPGFISWTVFIYIDKLLENINCYKSKDQREEDSSHRKVKFKNLIEGKIFLNSY